MEKKKSIINIQDLGLSATSQQTVGGQPILRVIFREHHNFIIVVPKQIRAFNCKFKTVIT
jgi:hypothetical protein